MGHHEREKLKLRLNKPKNKSKDKSSKSNAENIIRNSATPVPAEQTAEGNLVPVLLRACPGTSSHRNAPVFCDYCGREGHVVEECSMLKDALWPWDTSGRAFSFELYLSNPSKKLQWDDPQTKDTTRPLSKSSGATAQSKTTKGRSNSIQTLSPRQGGIQFNSHSTKPTHLPPGAQENVTNHVPRSEKTQKPAQAAAARVTTTPTGPGIHTGGPSPNAATRARDGKNLHLPTKIIVDSGATVHVFNQKQQFQEMHSIPSRRMHVVGGEVIDIRHMGTVHIHLPKEGGGSTILDLKNVFYVPNSPFCLLSVGLAEDAGIYCNFKEKTLTNKNGQTLGLMTRSNSEYSLRDAAVLPAAREHALTMTTNPMAVKPRVSTRLAAKRAAIDISPSPAATAPVAPEVTIHPNDTNITCAPTPTDPSIDRKVDNRKLLRTIFNTLQELTQESFQVELFAASDNNLLTRYYSKENDAFSHQWTNSSFYGNPPFTDLMIKSTITKAYHDWHPIQQVLPSSFLNGPLPHGTPQSIRP